MIFVQKYRIYNHKCKQYCTKGGLMKGKIFKYQNKKYLLRIINYKVDYMFKKNNIMIININKSHSRKDISKLLHEAVRINKARN